MPTRPTCKILQKRRLLCVLLLIFFEIIGKIQAALQPSTGFLPFGKKESYRSTSLSVWNSPVLAEESVGLNAAETESRFRRQVELQDDFDIEAGVAESQTQSFHMNCRQTMGTNPSKPHTVLLFRISPRSLHETDAFLWPIIFNIDTTVLELSIYINGTDAADVFIVDPEGVTLNDRVRRDAPVPPVTESYESSYANQQKQQQMQPLKSLKTDDDDVLEHKSRISTIKMNDSIYSKYPKRTFNYLRYYHQLSKQQQPPPFRGQQNPTQTPRAAQKLSKKHSIRQIITGKESVLHIAEQYRQKKLLYINKHELNSSKFFNMHHASPHVFRSHNSHISLQHEPFLKVAHSRKVAMKNKRSRPLWKQHVHDEAFRKKAAKRNDLENAPLLRQKGSKPKMDTGAPLDSNYHQRRLSKYSIDDTSWTKTELQKVILYFNNNGNNNNNNNDYENSNSYNDRANIINNSISNKENIRAKNKDITSRRKRSSSMISLNMLGDQAVWEVEPAYPGQWVVTVHGPLPEEVVVTGQSVLDFHVKFLDIRTMTGLDSQPVAFDRAIARIYFYGLECLTNASLLELMDEKSQTILRVEIDNTGSAIGQDSADPNDVKNTIMVSFMMPGVPFYMSLTGYNYMGEKYYRISPQQVVPRMFVISLVASRADPLVPGTDYNFGVRLRNKGRNDTFSVTVRLNDESLFNAKAVPDVLQVEQNEIAYVAIFVEVEPDIPFITKGIMTITAVRMSDGVTETMTDTVTAMPKSFQVDYEAPICTTISTSGGCKLHEACHVQRWRMSVAIVDSLTGVKTADFTNTPVGAFTSVQYQYSLTNRTAQADYEYTCCNPEAQLVVEDYADNPYTCTLVAPILTPNATSATFSNSVITMENTNMSSSALELHLSTSTEGTFETSSKSTESPFSASSPKDDHEPSKLSTIITAATTGTFETLSSSHKSTTTQQKTQRQVNKDEMSSSKMSMTSHVPPHSTDVNSVDVTSKQQISASRSNTTLNKRPTWDDEKFSTLRTAAIVCGCIGGLAGLGIIVVCIVYKCVQSKGPHRPGRQNSTDSDVTMGSSWESRSEGSSGTESLRLHRLGGGETGTWSDRGSLRGDYNIEDGKRNGEAVLDGENSSRFGDEHGNRGRHEMQNREGFGGGRVVRGSDGRLYFQKPKKDEDVKDVGYRCVVVSVVDDKKGDESVPLKGKEGHGNNDSSTGADEAHRALLASGGKIYTSMLEVQKRMEEMEKQRQLTSCSNSDDGNSTNLVSATSKILSDLSGTSQKREKMAANARTPSLPVSRCPFDDDHLPSYKEMSKISRLRNRNDVPPGSPQVITDYDDNELSIPIGACGGNESASLHYSDSYGEFKSRRYSETISTEQNNDYYDNSHPSDNTEICVEQNNVLTQRQRSNSDIQVYTKSRCPIRERESHENKCQNSIKDGDSACANIQNENDSEDPDFATHKRNRSRKTCNVETSSNLHKSAKDSLRGSPEDSRSEDAFRVSPECCTHSPPRSASGSPRYCRTPELRRHVLEHNLQASGRSPRVQRNVKHVDKEGVQNKCSKLPTPSRLVREDAQAVNEHFQHTSNERVKSLYSNEECNNTCSRSHASSHIDATNSKRAHCCATTSTSAAVEILGARNFKTSTETNHMATIPTTITNSNNNTDQDENSEQSTSDEEITGKYHNRQSPSPQSRMAEETSQRSLFRQRNQAEALGVRQSQQEHSPEVILDANQMALRNDIEHIRQRLLRFQRRIDQEIEEEERRSRNHSPCSSGNHSNAEDD